MLGAMPGDPLVDAIFAFSFGRFLGALACRLREAGLAVTLPPAQAGLFWDVVPLVAPAAALFDRVRAAGSVLSEVAREFGLQLNFKPDKTEDVVSVCGPDAREARAALPVVEESPLFDVSNGLALRIIMRYRHLGQDLRSSDWVQKQT